MRLLSLLLLTAACAAGARAEVVPLRKLSRTEQTQRIAGDLKAAQVYRQGLLAATVFAVRQTNLFPAVIREGMTLPRREEKELLWQTWKTYLDYLLALDAIEQYHRESFLLSGERRDHSFLAGQTAFLAKYRCSLEFISAADKNPVLDTILNEPVPELGLPAGTCAKVKFRYLNVAIATEFAARMALQKTLPAAPTAELRDALAADTDSILKLGKGEGELLTAKNALQIIRNTGEDAWFPVQAGVAEWMGDTKVYRPGRSLISQKQIQQLLPRLLPGDVMLTRREWYLSNVGLPGFWPHAALFIGTPDERRRFFAEADAVTWVRSQGVASGDFEELLRTRSPQAYAESLKPQEKSHLPRVLEAMSEGVSFTTIEHSADADSVVALRPLLLKREKAEAIVRAFHYAGRPYDFNFDFATDAEIVCTELVYKAYEPAQGRRGLSLPLVEMLGRQVLPANEIVHQFDAQSSTGSAQFDFVAFLDGNERENRAMEASLTAFRESWRRPKWHILTKASPSR